jgi:ATP-independent RNA helicase DbpA
MTEFTTLALTDPLQRGLKEVGYVEMTPVQASSLPAILAGRDVAAQARTGSGKTAAFALGLLSALDAASVNLQGLVLCPTRELADQVSREIRRLARFIPNIKVLTLCGGVPLRPHLASLAHEPHIVVGTPGRILELIQKEALPLKAIKVLVLDEADRMLDMGFADDLRSIIEAMPTQRQTLLFSATIPQSIREMSRELQRDPLDITVADEPDETTIEQTFFEVDEQQKLPRSKRCSCSTARNPRWCSAILDRTSGRWPRHSTLAVSGCWLCMENSINANAKKCSCALPIVVAPSWSPPTSRRAGWILPVSRWW